MHLRDPTAGIGVRPPASPLVDRYTGASDHSLTNEAAESARESAEAHAAELEAEVQRLRAELERKTRKP